MQHNTAIFETLFERNFSDSGNTDFLKEITSKYPYFTPAQFFLLHNTVNDSAAFEKQAVKTNILFNNPHWLHFQLKQTGVKVEEVQEVQEVLEVKAELRVMEAAIESPDDTEIPENYQEEKELEPMKIELKMPEQTANMDEAMLFEPMHIVDYFASQGIKLTDGVQTADKLGKQLKSFTEWLKTMKKVHVPDTTENAAESDQNIQTLAENSNTDTGVLTESMAEVFVKQGKTGKASEVYEKLSLLNPAKSTYFAAKIENLKGI